MKTAAASGLQLALSLCLVLGCATLVTSSTGSPDVGFLPTLPLKIVVTTPAELINAQPKDSVTLSARQALQVVFSRAVIALGADFGSAVQEKVPFTFTCNTPGRFRWVTTSIARLDPDQDWPTDLDCALKWNTNLTTYDGMGLNLTGVPPQRRLVTSPLSMSVSSVSSDRADNLTGGLWSAFIGAPNESLPEVPPDGVITLSFSAPVTLAKIASSLRLVAADGDQTIPMNVTSCKSPAYHWLAAGADVATQALLPHADYTDTCAQVQPLGSLGVNSRYNRLYLPEGTVYHPLSGPLKRDLSVPVYGLRRFRVPLRQDFFLTPNTSEPIYNGPRYRRLDLWLPHGLAKPTRPSHLAAHIKLCHIQDPSAAASSPCTPLNFTLTLAKPGLARLTAPDLQPHRLYQLSVKAAHSVRDGFRLPLHPSKQRFWTVDSGGFFATPALSNPVALFEVDAGADSGPITWPILISSPSERSAAAQPLSVTSAGSWPVQLTDQASVTQLVRLISAGGSLYIPDVLGAPKNEAKIPPSTSYPDGPQQLQLSLDPALASVHVVHTCCSYQPWLSPPGKISASVTIVTITSLAVAFVQGPASVTAWVTNTTTAGAGPVAGASVWLYYNVFAKRPQLAGNCSTDGSGICTIPMGNQSGSLVGVASSQGQAVVVPNAGFFTPSSPAAYVGTLVADRLVVRPGETLHLTGYMQQQAVDTSLSLPGAGTSVSLQVSRGWDPEHSDQPVYVPAVLAAGSGSVHMMLEVPATGVVGTFTLTLMASVPEGRHLGELDYDSSFVPDPRPDPRAARSALSGPDNGVATAVSSSAKASSTSSGRPAVNTDQPRLSAVASITITVADPRPPTAELVLTLPAWSLPNASVPVSVSAQSLIGTSVSAANVSLIWSTSRASGASSVVTDASGHGAASIDLGALHGANASSSGDVLSVTAEWVGPTRELLVQRAYVLLRDASRSVLLSLEPQTDTPGVAFGVTARVISNDDGRDLLHVPVNVTLTPDGAPECSGTGQPPCSLVSGPLDPASCQMALPCTGKFNLTACTSDQGQQACAIVQLGRNHSSWAAAPLSAADPLAIALVNTSNSFQLGDTVDVRVQVPRNASSLLFVWGNAKTLRSQAFRSLPAGSTTLPLNLGPECTGGCGLAALLSAPRAALPAYAGNASVPTSLLFDPLRPASSSAFLSISVRPSQPLNVSLALHTGQPTAAAGLASVLPGSNTTVQVSVQYDGRPAAGAEVTVIAVDKAVLDLLPYPLQDLSAAMVQQLAAGLRSVDVEALRVSPSGVKAAFAAALRRCLSDPWLSPDVQCQPQSWSTSPVDIPDEQYLAGFTTTMTYIPYTFNPCFNCMNTVESVSFGAGGAAILAKAPAPVPSGAAKTSADAAPASAPPRLQSQFLATPLFVVARSSGGGAVNVTFSAPANLGTFVVRAYASLWSQGPGTGANSSGAASQGGKGLYGSAEAQLLVRRPLSLVSALPPFVRLGDNFSAGVVVTATGLGPSDPPLNATVSLTLGNGTALQLLGSSQYSVTLSAAAPQQEVQFEVTASALGTASLTFAAAAADGPGGGDNVQLSLEVQGQQSEVVVATSFPVHATNSSAAPAWQEGVALPDAIPGSGALQLIAGVGYLPSILNTYNSLIRAYAQLVNPDGYSAFALSTLGQTVQLYNQSVTSAQALAESLAVSDLQSSLSDARLGLLAAPLAASPYGTPRDADIVLNAWAAWLAASWPQQQQGASSAPGAGGWAAVQSKAISWGVVAAQQLLTDAAAARVAQPGAAYSSFLSIAWVRLALGANWQPPLCKETYGTGLCAASADVAADVSLEQLVANASSSGLTTQLLTALALQQAGSSSPLVSATVDLVLSSLRVTARTAYVSAAPGSATAADQGSQALALLLLLTAPSVSPLLSQKLAAYVAQGSLPDLPFPGLCSRTSPMTSALAIRALASYDQAAGSTSPSLQLQVAVLNLTLLQATFTSSSASVASVNSSTPWELLPLSTNSTPSKLLFYASGAGEASIAAMMTFVPKAVMPFPTYRGLWVESSIQLLDPLSGSPTGPNLQTLPLASIVMVTLQVTTPDDLSAVTIEALMPGGLQPQDPNLGSSGALAAGRSSCVLDSALFTKVFWWWWWPTCPTQQTLSSQVTFRYTRMAAGTWTMQFLAVATTPGDFMFPPVKAYAEQQFEVMGMTAAGHIHVCKPDPGSNCTAQAAAAPAALPKACPSGCSGNGACRLDVGECLCSQGFTEADCSVPIDA